MKKKFQPSAAVLIGLLLTLGCSDSKDEGKDTSGNDSSSEGSGESDGNTGDDGSDVGSDGNIDNLDSENICDLVEQGFGKTTGKVMLLEDASSSMGETLDGNQTKWDIAKQALNGMVTKYASGMEFGLDLLPINGQCTVGTSVAIDTAPDNAANISARLDQTETSQSTPLYLAMANFSNDGYAPLFAAEGADPYLVVISDGQDSCGKSGQFQTDAASAEELASITESLLNENGIKTFVIGFGSGIDPGQLNAIAAAGGTQFTTYFDAQDEAALNAALDSIGQAVVVSCRYQIGDADPTADLNLTNIYFDGNGLSRGTTCDGNADWIWGNTEKTIVEFCPDACEMLESGQVTKLQVVIMCTEGDVIVV